MAEKRERLDFLTRLRIRDLWQHRPATSLTATVPPHGVVMLRVEPR